MNEYRLSVEEVAAHLGVTQNTFPKWVVRQNMSAHKMGRWWRFPASEVDKRVHRGKTAQKRVPRK
ncbi:excisionase family DNA-binding protein [Fontisphaera persica]|uniref:excisionase family DNA-binding protein n=1 Tax=Fontisphaera persica TaxID=2974023 RepID=UPI0024BF8D13|nr:excisionase family DNA-binding protein [Fontisphaera persica]WCJ60919.1 excisionase family DNA-binding protein [Fontisphaera persica]